MDKTAIILQLFGLGDQIFTITLCHEFISEGYKIIYPVQEQFLEGNNRAYPEITFVSESLFKPELFAHKKDFVLDGVRIIPIRFAEAILNRPYRNHMISKYDLYHKDWKIWKRNAYPKRYPETEAELKKILGIAENEEYNFIQTKFGSKGRYQHGISIDNGLKNIELTNIEGYSLFDWCGVIEGATMIHSVSSSTLYLYELLDLKAKECHLYIRKPIEHNFDYVSFLFTKPYILHQ